MRKRCSLILFLLVFSSKAEAQSSFGGEVQARSFTRLWSETCATHVGIQETKNLIAKLDSDKRYRRNPDYAAGILGKKKGTVWDVSDASLNIVQAVTVYEAEKTLSLRCQVHIRKVDNESARKHFDAMMPKLISPSVKVTALDGVTNTDGVDYQKRTLSLHRPGSIILPYFTLETSSAPSAPWQAVMSQWVGVAY